MKYERLKLNKGWGTHMTMLIKLVQMTDGPVMELGSGLFSTPLLHWLCKERNIKLLTYENNFENNNKKIDIDYFKFAKTFQSKNHRIRFIKDWKEIDAETHWGVVLIDHHPPEQRGIDAIRLKDKADYIVLHDTETPEEYGYDKVWSHFKYRYDWKECRPWTTVVSNTIDVTKMI